MFAFCYLLHFYSLDRAVLTVFVHYSWVKIGNWTSVGIRHCVYEMDRPV